MKKKYTTYTQCIYLCSNKNTNIKMENQIKKNYCTFEWYVCTKYNCTWYDMVENMNPEYDYSGCTFFFNTEEECIEFIKNLNDFPF